MKMEMLGNGDLSELLVSDVPEGLKRAVRKEVRRRVSEEPFVKTGNKPQVRQLTMDYCGGADMKRKGF